MLENNGTIYSKYHGKFFFKLEVSEILTQLQCYEIAESMDSMWKMREGMPRRKVVQQSQRGTKPD